MPEETAESDGAELELLRAGIHLMALRTLGNAELAGEVAQESIVRAFHSLRSSRPEKLGAFVAGIARHVIADVIRARPREVPLDVIAPDSEPRTHLDSLTMLCDASEHTRVHQALGLLSPDDRALLRLVFFDGLTPGEIAVRLGAPPERIRQRKLRALGRLRIAFDEAIDVTTARHESRPEPTVQGIPIEAVETLRGSE